MARWGIALIYSGLTLAVLLVAVLGPWPSPFVYPTPWLVLDPGYQHLYSGALGLAFGALVVALTPPMVVHLTWARELHRELRPIASAMSPWAIVLVGPTSAIVEEVVFRGFLQPWIGLVGQAVLFGLVHYMPGRSRWVWVGWAMGVGLVFGVLFVGTGSLIGPILAHATINWLNLRFLRSFDPEPRRRPLGGLLGERG